MFLSFLAISWLLGTASANVDKIRMSPDWLLNVTDPTTRFNSYVRSMLPHPNNPLLLITTDSFSVWEFNPQKKTKTLIAGSKSSGNSFGSAEKAQFGAIWGTADFNKTTIIVSDLSNHCLKLVNTVTRVVERYAGTCGSSGYKDSDRLTAKFNQTFGLSWIGDTLYISDRINKKIRQISQDQVSTLVSFIKNPYGLASSGNTLLYSFGYGIGSYDIKAQVNKILVSASGYVDGKLTSSRFSTPYGIAALENGVFALADYNNRAIRIVDLNKKVVSSVDVNVTNLEYPASVLAYDGFILTGLGNGKILKFATTKLPITQNNITCQDDLSLSTTGYSILFQPQIDSTENVVCRGCPTNRNLTIGVYTFLYTYYNKIGYIEKLCKQTVNVNAVLPTVKYPENIKLQLPEGATEINVTLPQPDITGTRLECVSCPSLTQRLRVGKHELKFVYQDKLTKKLVIYSHWVEVSPSVLCYNTTRRIFIQPDENTTNELRFGETGVNIGIKSRVHKVEIRKGCFITFVINQMSGMERDVYLEAEYPIDCTKLNNISFSVIDSHLLQHTKYMRKYCSVCQLGEKSTPEVKCTKNSLIAKWKTGIKGDYQDLTKEMKIKLHTALIGLQIRYSILDIIVVSALPRTVSPIKDSRGLSLRVVIENKCTDKQFRYNEQYDVCERNEN